MLNYNFPLFRPPAEANNIIIQATLGCSHNQCTFCSMYKSKKYSVRPLEEVYKEIDTLSTHFPEANKVFLADGDALALTTDHLISLLDYLSQSFPRLSRVSVYATAQNLLQKSPAELTSLRESKLTLLYFGVETGDETLLQFIHKGVKSEEIIEALDKAHAAQMKVSATVILGLGGKAKSKEHIQATATLLNATQVTYLSTLQLGLEENIKEHFLHPFHGNFKALTDQEIIEEQKQFITLLNPKNKLIFRSNHASNALPLKGTLPKDRQRLLNEIDRARTLGDEAFVPQAFRGF
ncbi:MAG: radical SAM protein [Thiovulaceae bacterium]|nr:radical SAM protein [Sulfurimonadaceae bacterium]